MNIQILIFGIVFILGGQSIQAAAMPQFSPADQKIFEKRLAEQRAKAKQSKMVHQSRAPRGAELRQLQGAIAQGQPPAPLPRSTPSSSSSALQGLSSGQTETQPTPPTKQNPVSDILRQIGSNVQLAFPLQNTTDLNQFTTSFKIVCTLKTMRSGKKLFTGSTFVDATVPNVLRTWGSRGPSIASIDTPQALKNLANLYGMKKDAPSITLQSLLQGIASRYSDILSNPRNQNDFKLYNTRFSHKTEGIEDRCLNRGNEDLDEYVEHITSISNKDYSNADAELLRPFITAIASSQWVKETLTNQNIISESAFYGMIIKSAIAVLVQMKNGRPFFPSMHKVFGEFYLGAPMGSSAPASSSTPQPFNTTSSKSYFE